MPTRHGRVIDVPHSVDSFSASISAIGSVLGRRGSAAVDVLWPQSHLLERRIPVPMKARRRAEQIADLDLARATPIDRDTVVWRNQIEASGDQLYVRQSIVKKLDIAEVERELQKLGLKLRTVRLDADPPAPDPLIDNSKIVSRPWRWWRRIEFAAILCMVAAAGYIFAAPHLARVDELVKLKSRSAALLIEAETLSAQMREKEVSAEAYQNVREMLFGPARIDAVLAALTSELPDGAWVQSVQLNRTQLILTGFAKGHAAELVSGFKQSSVFENASLSGQVSYEANSKSERFQLTLSIRQKRQHDGL